MELPEWVEKHKIKGHEIKYIRGKCYLYKVTSKWDPIKKNL